MRINRQCKELHVHMEKMITQVKNIGETVEEKINTGNTRTYNLNQRDDGLA